MSVGSCLTFQLRSGHPPQVEIRMEAARVLGVRKARASGDLETLAQAAFAARDAQNEHRSRLEAVRNGEGTADVGGEDDGAGADPGRAVSKAGLDVIRKFESILRGLGRGR